jgi:hypothetical protein
MVLQLTNSSYHEIEKAIVVLIHPTAFIFFFISTFTTLAIVSVILY